jgi:peptidylprolyl isomerase domain and WD repeat-containing protein 1
VIQYNAVAGVAVSVDTSHMVEYWCGPKQDYQFPKNVQWEFKTDTDLFEFLKVSDVSPPSF